MGWGLSNLFDPAGITTGDKGDWVNNSLDPIGGIMQNYGWGSNSDLGDLHNNVGDWMDDTADFNSSVLQDRTRGLRSNPERFMWGDPYTAGNPVGTRIGNEVFHRDDKPMWDIYGGANQQNYQNAEAKGIDSSDAAGLYGVGNTVGKGILNAYTYGLGSTAMDAMDDWGNKDNSQAEDVLKNGIKNYATNYALSGLTDYAGNSIPATGGYTEQGGGYVGNNDYGGTGGFNLGKTVGAGDYTPVVNNVAKGAVSQGLSTAASGGNSTSIGQNLIKGGISNGIKPGASMIGNYFNNDSMPDTGTLGGTMSDMYGENSATMGGQVAPSQVSANQQAASTGFVPSSMPLNTGGMRQAQSTSSPVTDFINAYAPASSTGNKGGLGNYGDLASNLFGMYNAMQQRKRLSDQQGQLSSLFAPNSPYAQMAQQRMDRLDAAGGRNSQYGNRAVQLAALLADKQASTMPQQNAYANQIGQYNNMMVNNGLKFGQGLYNNRASIGGGLDSLYNLFGGGQQ